MRKIIFYCLAGLMCLACATKELKPGMEARKRWHSLHFELEAARTKNFFEFWSLFRKTQDEILHLALTGYPPVLDYLFFLGAIADAGFADDIGCLLDAVHLRRPDLYRETSVKQPENFRERVEFARAICHGEPAD